MNKTQYLTELKRIQEEYLLENASFKIGDRIENNILNQVVTVEDIYIRPNGDIIYDVEYICGRRGLSTLCEGRDKNWTTIKDDLSPLMVEKLSLLRDFQEKYPYAHVGGSIGLMLHGQDLKRDLSTSDLDITNFEEIQIKSDDVDMKELNSSSTDFDSCVLLKGSKDLFLKVDLRISPEPSYETVVYKGFTYNVSKLENILFWKKKCASKGDMKHIKDLVTLGIWNESMLKEGVEPFGEDWELLF